jgi:hypothetical protein
MTKFLTERNLIHRDINSKKNATRMGSGLHVILVYVPLGTISIRDVRIGIYDMV